MKIAAVVVLYNPDDNVQNNIKSYINGVDKVFAIDNIKYVDRTSNALYNKIKEQERL